MNCPGCEAYTNPAWKRCHACGDALKGAAFIETVKPDTTGPATEADFERVDTRHRSRAARLNLQGARYVRYLDRGIRRIYSRKVSAWLYIVQSKAAVRGVRLRPRGAAVYTVEECRALLTANPGADELRTLHRAKTMFEGELTAGGVPP